MIAGRQKKNPEDVPEWMHHLANIGSLIKEQNATGKALEEELLRGKKISQKYWPLTTTPRPD